MNKGSIWRKWDLHVHSPASYGGSYDNFIQNLISSEAEAIGINDYCTIDGYKEVISRGGVRGKTIFPVIEFRMNNMVLDKDDPRAKSGPRINFHIIFNNNSGILSRIDTWLSALEGFRKGGTKDKLGNVSDLEERKNFSLDYFNVIQSLESDSGLKGQFLAWLPYDEYGGIDDIDPENDGYFKLGLINKTHIIGSSNKKQIDFFLWNHERHTSERIKTWLNNRKIACIKGSDAHRVNYPFGKLTNERSEPIEKYCWIKSDLSFEGLYQIVHEPELRVRIQKENPSSLETYTRIESCIIDFPPNLKITESDSHKEMDFCIKGKYEVGFSNNLTCIIGGRGSGKSAFIHILYNVWNERDSGKLSVTESPLISLKLAPDPLSKIRNLTKATIPFATEFFFQNEIEKFAKAIDEMSKLVLHRLERLSTLEVEGEVKKGLEGLKNEWNEALSAIDKLIDAHDNISSLNAQIKELEENKNTLQKQTEVIQSQGYKEFQIKLGEISEKISSFRNYTNEYQDILKHLEAARTTINAVEWSKEAGGDILKKIQKTLKDRKIELNKKYADIKNKYDQNDYAGSLIKVKSDFKKYLKEKGLSPENVEELADATEQIKNLESEIKLLKTRRTPYDEIYSNKSSAIDNYQKAYDTYSSRYKEVCALFEKKLSELAFDNRKISFASSENRQHLEESVIKFVKENSSNEVTLQSDEIRKIIFEDVNLIEYITNKDKIREHINECQKAITHKKILEELLNNESFLERLHLRIIKGHFDISNIQVRTTLGDKALKNTSFGERCGIVIAIILVAGTNPIIIDQPEDNLDGKFISNVLVPLIRQQKQNRQIVLVTRDANIAVGSDAELINILEDNSGHTELIPSSIENTVLREKYVWILDGGVEAFQKRERKYNFA